MQTYEIFYQLGCVMPYRSQNWSLHGHEVSKQHRKFLITFTQCAHPGLLASDISQVQMPHQFLGGLDDQIYPIEY